MTTVMMGVREVTRRTSEVFERASNGETIIVTNRGRVVEIITPPQAYSPHPEPESMPLRTWLARHPADLLSSALVRTRGAARAAQK